MFPFKKNPADFSPASHKPCIHTELVSRGGGGKKRKNPTALLFNNCSATKFYWYLFMFPPEDVMHKSIATEHIKLQMKFIVKSRLSPRRVSVFPFFHSSNRYCEVEYIHKGNCPPPDRRRRERRDGWFQCVVLLCRTERVPPTALRKLPPLHRIPPLRGRRRGACA